MSLTIIRRFERRHLAKENAHTTADTILLHSDGTFCYGDGEPCPGVVCDEDMQRLLDNRQWAEMPPGKPKAQRKLRGGGAL